MIALIVLFVVPSCARGRWIGRMCPIVAGVLALLAYPACSGGDRADCPPPCVDGETRTDGGLGSSDAAGPPMADRDAGATAGFEGAARADACFNGADDNGDGTLDCEDPTCGAAAYCCVGETGASCCTGGGQDLTLDFATCAAASPADCGDAVQIGSPPSLLEEGRFLPNGDAGSDSGLSLGLPIDATRERVVLAGRLIGPVDGCEGEGCVDAILLGLAGPPDGTTIQVRPDVAVMVRGSRGDFALVIAGEVVARWPLTSSDAQRYELELTPDGGVIFSVGEEGREEVFARARYLPRSDRRALLWGRNHNRSGERPPSSATEVTVNTETCDVPSALRRDVAPVAPWPDAMWTGLSASSPSMARAPDGQTLLAIELPDGIGLLQPDADGWAVVGDLRAPPVAPPVNERYEDPELVVEDDRFVLYLTHEHADGARTIARAEGGPGFAPSFDAPIDVTLPADAQLEAPAVVDFGTTSDGAPRRLMAATLSDDEGTHVALLEATDAVGATFEWAMDAPIVDPGADFAFDDDEVGDPDLSVDRHGLLRLYYAGRRGTRWAIGVRVSGDSVHWRVPDEGAAIFSGSGQGFDALGVRDPSVVIDGTERLLFYTGSDGARGAVGRAVGQAP